MLDVTGKDLCMNASVLRKGFFKILAIFTAMASPLIIGVNGDVTPPPWPVVSIVAAQPETSEPNSAPTGAANPIPGKFTISRTGSLDAALPVYLTAYSGTATAGADYKSLPTKVSIAAGETSVDLLVEAFADT